eukprot:scaffold50510_cov54-Phaeocystis_antarctica.AAC.6
MACMKCPAPQTKGRWSQSSGTGGLSLVGQGASIKTRAHLVDWLRVQWTREHRGAVCGYRWRVTVEGDEGLVQEPAPERNWEQRDDDLPPLEEALLGHLDSRSCRTLVLTRCARACAGAGARELQEVSKAI